MADFSSLLGSFQRCDDFFKVDPGDDWGQGRTLYGGASLALASHAARLSFPDLPPLRSVQAAFTGAPEGPLCVRAKMINAGKSTFFVGVDLSAKDRTTLHATFCYGKARASVLDYQDFALPAVSAPESCGPLFPETVTPNFAVQFDSRLAGAMPLIGGGQTAELLGWARHRDQNVTDGEAGFLALADSLPPAAMAMFDKVAPVGTINWMITLLSDVFSPSDWHLIQSRGEFIQNGYCSQSMKMWSQKGDPLAFGYQQVAIYY